MKGLSEPKLHTIWYQGVLAKMSLGGLGDGCSGWNTEVYDGIPGKANPFFVWDQYVKLSDYEDSLRQFEEFFRADALDNCNQDEKFLNKYWQTRYSLFTCYDMHKLWGIYKFDSSLIERWEKPRELHKQWALGLMSCVYNKRLTNWSPTL